MDDKIREEFEKEWRFHDGDNFPFGVKRLCLLFWQAKDPEIEKLSSRVAVAEGKNVELENDCKNLVQINKNQSSNMNNWQEDIADLVTENKKLREIIECKNTLLYAYRTGSRKGVEKALDKLQALKDGE